MPPKASGQSASEELLGHMFSVMRENEGFLHDSAEEVYDVVVRLANDAIEQAGLSAETAKHREHPADLAMSFFVHHALIPFNYAVYVDLRAGNPPACFTQIRSMLETMAECYLADVWHPGGMFFQDKIEALRQEKMRPSTIIWQAGRMLGCKEQYLSLWGKLSQDWLHPNAITDRVVGHIVETANLPAWALIIPMNYADDLQDLDKLGKRTLQFKDLLSITMSTYWENDN